MSASNGHAAGVFGLSDPDEGYLFVACRAGAEPVKVDAFEANNRIAALGAEYGDKPLHEYHAAVVRVMQDMGLPPVSHYKAVQFVEAVRAEVARLEGKSAAGNSTTPASPASTPA